jgi:hypothetical protein
MRSWVSLAALFVTVVVLGAWVYYKPAPGSADSHALSALKSKDVKRVRLERVDTTQPSTSAAAIVLERHNDDWRMTAPIAARAETFQIERLLSILEARASARYPANDLARYGLDKPFATVRIEDQTFDYGAINRTTREQYVRTGNAVYLVALAYSTSLPRNADALLARQVLAASEVPVRFELADFSVSLHDGTWTVTPASNEMSADERNAWVDAWRHASAIRAAHNPNRAARADIRVELKDGRTIAIDILRREPELVLLRRDEGIEYHFFGDSGRPLISPPGTRQQKTDAVTK